MLLRSLLPTVALALTANAFLVPPHIADKASHSLDEALNHADITALFRQDQAQNVDLECKSCRVVFRDERTNALVDVPKAKTSVQLKFTNVNNEISVNNVKIYPPTIKEMAMRPLVAVQKTSDPSVLKYHPQADRVSPHAVLSYSIDVVSETPFKDAISSALVIQVLGVNDEVADIGAVAVGVLKKPDGTLILHSVNQISPTMSPTAKQCTTLMCRIKATVAEKTNALRAAAASKWASLRGGCARNFGGKKQETGHRGPTVKGGPGKYWGRLRPNFKNGDHHRGPPTRGGIEKYRGRFPPATKDDQNQHHHHHHHHHHHRQQHSTMHKVASVLHTVLRFIILPIMIGVGAGMAASAIGMLVGQMICVLWMRYRRSRNPEYAPVHQVDLVEEEGRVSSDTLPPKYEDVEVVDEKEELN